MTTAVRVSVVPYCPKCNKRLAGKLSGYLEIRCKGCKSDVVLDTTQGYGVGSPKE